MAKQNWKPIDLMDVIGMASNPVNPGTKFAKRLLNVYTHERPGALTLRPGYAPKYTAPSNTTITNSEVLNFGVFFDRQADPNGQEIICEVQRGIVEAIRDTDTNEPIVPNTMQGFWFWVRPYWDGVQWLNNWQWVNQTIITKITAEDAAYPSKIKVFGNLAHGINDDTLIGWTIYNVTKNQYARIITCKLETPHVWLNITLYDNEWEIDDVVIISRCWIDVDEQLELYNNVAKEDIVFHRINNDLRIGFGGEENRPGLMLGYRKNYLLLNEIDFTEKDPALLESDVIEKFAKTDGIILEKNILDKENYGVEITTSEGTLEAGTYYFKMTGIADDFEEQLVAESNIQLVGDTTDIIINPTIIIGKNERRLTKLILYYSSDGITYYKISDYVIRLQELSDPVLTLEEGSFIRPDRVSFSGEGNFHRDSNAASTTNEIDSIGQWQKSGSQFLNLYSVESFIFFTGNQIPSNGSNFIVLWDNELQWTPPFGYDNTTIKSPQVTNAKQTLVIEFDLMLTASSRIRISSEPVGIPNPFGDDPAFIDIQHNASPHWTHYSIQLEVNGRVTFRRYDMWGGELSTLDYPIGIDAFSVTKVNPGTPEISSEEMTDSLGYTPTYNLVKGWDKVLLKDGRAYYFNPYVDKRYDNFILVSHIKPPSIFMWDIASFDNFRELEKYDSNELIGAELLPNKEILILKDASVTTLSDDGRVGIAREPVYGVDCISKSSIVNINGLVFWCGKEEVYVLNIGRSLVPEPMLKNTIRDLYLAIEDKTKIFGTRNRFNTYRIRVDDEEQKTEYLLTENGWVEERKWHYAKIYRTGFNNKLYFLNNGMIYEEQVDFSLPGIPYGEEVAD